MSKVWTLLLLAVITFPREVRGDDGVTIEPFGCANSEVFYNNRALSSRRMRGR
jgi:hypothetical protein